MDAIVTAGGTAGTKDPLFSLIPNGNKALLNVAGRPMIEWILDALLASNCIDHIVVAGLSGPPVANVNGKIAFIGDQGGMMDNIRAGIEHLLKVNPAQPYSLVVASDIPAITAEMINWLSNQMEQAPADILFSVVERRVMEQRYPGSNRTYTRLKGLEVCGGDANVIRKHIGSQAHPLWQRLHQARKSPLHQARLVGLDLLVRLLSGQLTLQQAEQRVGQRLGIHGRAILSPYAEIGMDIDKPFQLEIVQADLLRRQAV